MIDVNKGFPDDFNLNDERIIRGKFALGQKNCFRVVPDFNEIVALRWLGGAR